MDYIAIDPGKVTGIAAREEGVEFSSSEIPTRAQVYAWLSSLPPVSVPTTFIIERYDITGQTHKLSAQKDALYLIGATEMTAQRIGARFYLSPRSAKAFATDAKLRHLGWYKPSKGGHQNDAARHLLTFLAQEVRDPAILNKLKEMM